MLRFLPHVLDMALDKRDFPFGEFVFGVELGVDFGYGFGPIDVGKVGEVLTGDVFPCFAGIVLGDLERAEHGSGEH